MTFRPGVLLVACLLALGLTGCVGSPDPAPSTTAPAFASDAEAYKAAEKVYREYVDALNKVDLADPKTFEPVFALTTGEANANDRQHFSQMHADRWVVSGKERATAVEALPGQTLPTNRTHVELAVCLNVADVHLVDRDGVSMVSPDRPDIQSMRVSLEFKGENGKISAFNPREGQPKCGS